MPSLPIATPLQRARAWLNMHLVDHGFIRAAYSNFGALGGDMYRCSQPSPAQVRRYHESLGIRSILNLRGPNPYGSYPLEQEVCEHLGIALIDLPIYSRRAPRAEEVLALQHTFATLQYPALLHCKAGADRAGMASALYRILHLEHPVEDAMAELSWRYGHFKQAKTGILDFFLATYLARNRQNPIPFITWVTTEYDWQAVEQAFESDGWASLLVDKVLHRE
jgi:protein tyrosine/serine phosphatase